MPRITGEVPNRKALFDISASGPIAGFIASSIILVVGFSQLSAKEYLFTIHPD